jgi:hypothetical protein
VTYENVRISHHRSKRLTPHPNPERFPNTQTSPNPALSSKYKCLDPLENPISDGRINSKYKPRFQTSP